MRSYAKQACEILFLQHLLPGRVQLPVYPSLLHFPHLVFCDRTIFSSCVACIFQKLMEQLIPVLHSYKMGHVEVFTRRPVLPWSMILA